VAAKELKKKRPSIDEEELRKLADQAMEDFKREAKARYDKAMRVYNAQDGDTQEAFDRMISLLVRIARKTMWVGVGKRSDRIVMPIPEETITHNMTYLAVEVLKDLAQMDVKVAGFKFPKGLCVECYAQITQAKPKKKVRK
jgi:hypothetical protein